MGKILLEPVPMKILMHSIGYCASRHNQSQHSTFEYVHHKITLMLFEIFSRGKDFNVVFQRVCVCFNLSLQKTWNMSYRLHLYLHIITVQLHSMKKNRVDILINISFHNLWHKVFVTTRD